MKIETIRGKQVITVEQADIVHAGLHGSRMYVILNQPADKHGRSMCITRWDDYKGAQWECSFEFIGEDWAGIDGAVANEVVGRSFVVKSMIDEY